MQTWKWCLRTWRCREHAACCPVNTHRINDVALTVQVWTHHGVGARGGVDGQVKRKSAVLVGLLEALGWQQVVKRPEHMRQRLCGLGSAFRGKQNAATVALF